MILVAVSQRVDTPHGYTEWRDGLDQRLTEWLLSIGCMPVPVPNALASAAIGGEDMLAAWLRAVQPTALLLSGGNDIGDRPERDRTEAQLLAWARDGRRPVLGLCRGMQMLGTWSGGALQPVAGHVRSRHTLQGQIGGPANSFHCFSLSACPPEYTVIARADDGEIEAIRHKHLPWEGWMWHPEREYPFDLRDQERAKMIFSQCPPGKNE